MVESDIEDVMRWMTESLRKVGMYGLKDCSEEVVNKVVQGLMKDKENFKAVCLKNFPLKGKTDNDTDMAQDDAKKDEDLVGKAVQGIKDSINANSARKYAHFIFLLYTTKYIERVLNFASLIFSILA